MYIVIFEDGTMSHRETINSELLKEADNGVTDIIDISDPSDPLRYLDEGWCSLEAANR
jgi:hypothetical protein